MSAQLAIIFAYHYPPENAIGGLRPFRFRKYLEKRGLDCVVVTAAAGASAPGVIEVADPFSQRRGLGWHLERTFRRFVIPGAIGVQWSLRASASADAVLRARPGCKAVIFSTYPPLGTHLAALHLAWRRGIPWIADFRDPLGGESDRVLPAGARRRLSALERRVMRRARFVIANTDSAADRLRALYPHQAAKVRLIWNGFDPEARLHAEPVPDRPYRLLSHVGELYWGRTAVPILQSLARLIAQGRMDPRSVRVKLVGPADPSCLPAQDAVDAAIAQGWLELKPETVPQAEARSIAAGSDALLLIQPHTSVQVPGKLFEYLQLGRPILALVTRESPSERILEKSGIPFRCVYADSPADVQDDTIAGFFSIPTHDSAPSAWFEENFNAEFQTAALHQFMNECLEAGAVNEPA